MLAALFTLTLPTLPASAQNPPQNQLPNDPDARLKLARDAFARGDVSKLRPLLYPVLDPTPLLDTLEARIEARSMLGFGLYSEALRVTNAAQHQKFIEQAREQFLALMLERPDHKLDTGIYPASVIALFENVRTANKAKLDARRKELSDPKDNSDTKLETIYIERVVRRRYWALNLAPFGVGQFQNNDVGWGIAFGAAQALALGVNVTSALAVETIRQQTPTGRFPTDGTFQLAQNWQLAQMISAGALLALYAGSVGHSLWRYNEIEVERIKTLDRPPPELAPEPRGSLMIGPGRVGWRLEF